MHRLVLVAVAAASAAFVSLSEGRASVPGLERRCAVASALDRGAPLESIVRSRQCVGRADDSLGLALLAAEARHRLNDEAFRALAALADTLARYDVRRNAPDAGVALAYAAIGVVYGGRGSEGLALIGRAESLASPDSPLAHARVLRTRAIAAERLSDPVQAERATRAYLAFVECCVPEPHHSPLRQRAVSDLASGLLTEFERGRMTPAAAPRRLGEALRLARTAEALASGDPEARAIAQQLVADALHHLGRLDEAQRAYRTLARNPAMAYYAHLGLGRVALRQGDAARAVEAFRRAATAAEDQPDAHEALYELGIALDAAGQADEALDVQRQAVRHLDTFTAEVGSDDAWRHERAVLQRPHRHIARLLTRRGRAAEALVALDASRARLLRASLARSQALAADTPDGQRLAALQARIAVLVAERARTDGARADRLDAELAAARAEVERASPLPSLPPLDVPRLQRHLGRQRAVLVAYLLDAPEPTLARPVASLAFVVSPDTVAVVPIAADAVARDLGAVTGAQGRRLSVDALRRLHDALVGPTRRLWPPGTERLVVVPDGPLFALPFAALAVQGRGFDYGAARFLADDLALSTDVSAGMALHAMETPPRPIPASGPVAVVTGRSRFATLPPLPDVPGEVRRVARRVGRSVALLDDAATEAGVVARLRGARVFHVATHATAGDAATTALHLAPGGGRDGLLRLHEMAALSLPLDLAFLSGCETARGAFVAGEGMEGLQYGLRGAGARSVVSTYWRVYDEAQERLATAFYEALARGARRDDALRAAQQAVRADWPDPASWAAPVLYGAAGPLPLPPPRPPAALVFGAALAAAAAAAVAWRRHRRRS